jgi:hypothetical protein
MLGKQLTAAMLPESTSSSAGKGDKCCKASVPQGTSALAKALSGPSPELNIPDDTGLGQTGKSLVVDTTAFRTYFCPRTVLKCFIEHTFASFFIS